MASTQISTGGAGLTVIKEELNQGVCWAATVWHTKDEKERVPEDSEGHLGPGRPWKELGKLCRIAK